MRNQAELDSEIASQLQAEEQVRSQQKTQRLITKQVETVYIDKTSYTNKIDKM